MNFQIEVVDHRHDCESFKTSDQSLAAFIHAQPQSKARKAVARTYVAVPEETNTVAGYFTMTSGKLKIQDPPKGVRKDIFTTAHICRLAVDRKFNGEELDSLLLTDALMKARDLPKKLGIQAVTATATSRAVKKFYESYGFEAFGDTPNQLFLPMKVIQAIA